MAVLGWQRRPRRAQGAGVSRHADIRDSIDAQIAAGLDNPLPSEGRPKVRVRRGRLPSSAPPLPDDFALGRAALVVVGLIVTPYILLILTIAYEMIKHAVRHPGQ